jgi:hypothetical protein
MENLTEEKVKLSNREYAGLREALKEYRNLNSLAQVAIRDLAKKEGTWTSESQNVIPIRTLREIRAIREGMRKANEEYNLPPNLITRKIYERGDVVRDGYENLLTVEILCTNYIDIIGQINYNTMKKILGRI